MILKDALEYVELSWWCNC